MCHGIPNITFHVFCCSKSALWFFGICRKRTSMHHILHNDLHFLPHTCHANPAGTVILHVFRYTNLRFFTNFTLRAYLKRQYCVSLTFWVWNLSGIVGFNHKPQSSSLRNSQNAIFPDILFLTILWTLKSPLFTLLPLSAGRVGRWYYCLKILPLLDGMYFSVVFTKILCDASGESRPDFAVGKLYSPCY